MTKHGHGLRRLAALYGKVEQMRSLQVQAASSAVAEVLHASREEADLQRIHVSHGRAAMLAGDAEALAVAATESAVSYLRQTRLEEIRQAREMLRLESLTAHQASRVQLKQMENIVEHAYARHRLDELRTAQSQSDDRYAARLAWKKALGSNPPASDPPSMKPA